MTIHVTPIPRLIDLAAPSFTLGTANAAGAAVTAVASDATLLAFDTTDPAAVAASAVVGSATVSARRDHVHAGTTATGTVVDEAITRFDGTGGASLQGYSSLSPTISDAGIISLTSGALKFPATAIAAANVNTLDDYEEGTFTPAITFGGGASGVSYGSQLGAYTKIGDRCYFTLRLVLTDKGSDEGVVNVTGLPFTVKNNAANYAACPVQFSVVSFADMVMVQLNINDTIVVIWESTNAGVLTQLNDTNYADNSTMHITGQYKTA